MGIKMPKGVVFESFPPVLHLQLKRFEYDFMVDDLVKIDDFYEFPDKIDLKPYLDEDLPEDVKTKIGIINCMVCWCIKVVFPMVIIMP